MKRTKATPAGSNGNSKHTVAPEVTEQKRDLLIRDLWQQGTDSVHDMRVVTGAWLTVLPSTVNGTELGAQEWRGALFLRYGLEPPDLPSHCDGCDAKFSISHALD